MEWTHGVMVWLKLESYSRLKNALYYVQKFYDQDITIQEAAGHLPNLEAVRLMSCETEIHSLAFLNALPRLRVLEIGQVHLNTLEGLDRLIGLEKLCIWSN